MRFPPSPLRDRIADLRGGFTRASATGPLSALWLTPRRVGWGMLPAAVLVDDARLHVDLAGSP
eukprot:7269752-Pyramimonas_sp.AAC.1